MSEKRKKYENPRYEVIKFDAQITTAWISGCKGVVGVEYESGGTCRVTYDPDGTPHYPNTWATSPAFEF